MPNWVRNMILVPNEDNLNEIVNYHCPFIKGSKRRAMDFNTITKMPADLNIEFSSRSEDGLKLLLALKNPSCHFFGLRKDKVSEKEWKKIKAEVSSHTLFSNNTELKEDEFRLLEKKYQSDLASVLSLGKRCLHNIEKYGSMNWYEWSNDNWGTKWNAENTMIGKTNFTFDTAWNAPIQLMLKMSLLHSFRMVLLYADEEIGARVGFAMMDKGVLDNGGSFKDFSTDARKLAYKVWGLN